MAFIALTGCAQIMVDHQRFLAGWRPGRIVEIDTGPALRARFAQDCRESALTGSDAGTQYAMVKYQQRHSVYRYRVAPMSVSPGLRVGDRVEININRCGEPLLKLPGRTD